MSYEIGIKRVAVTGSIMPITDRVNTTLRDVAGTEVAITGGADGVSAANKGLKTMSLLVAYNGVTDDRWRPNTESTLLSSLARTATATSPNITNYNATGVILYLNVTAASGTGGLQVQLLIYDPTTGTNFTVNAPPTAILAVGRYAYTIYPGATEVGIAGSAKIQQFTSAPVSRTFGALVTAVDVTSYTYSLGYSLIL